MTRFEEYMGDVIGIRDEGHALRFYGPQRRDAWLACCRANVKMVCDSCNRGLCMTSSFEHRPNPFHCFVECPAAAIHREIQLMMESQP